MKKLQPKTLNLMVAIPILLVDALHNFNPQTREADLTPTVLLKRSKKS